MPPSSASPEKPKAQKAAIQSEKESKNGEGSVTASIPSDQGEAGSSASNEEVMKSLIEEAGKMLKSMSVEEPRKVKEEDRGAEKLIQLQRQLDALTMASVKVMRLTKVGWHGQRGLVDSGATHALRGRRPRAKIEMYPTVEVQLAGGQSKMMHLSPQGILIGSPEIEPILCMGALTTCLGCSISRLRRVLR